MAIPETRAFKVALCGFSDGEQKVLGRAFMLSEVRPRRYLLWEQDGEPPHLCLVNEDLAGGPQAWVELRDRLPGAMLAVVRVGIADKSTDLYEDVTNVFFKRPVLAKRILKVLDDLVTEVYRFAPELAIHDDAPLTPGSGLVAEPAQESAKRILVVDDSESVRKVMELRLTRKGHAVDFATTGEEALTKAREQSYDLIFLDVMLPGINGYDVSRHLKRDIRVASPVVMLTSKTSRIDKIRGTLASADAYLTKPLTIEGLDDTLRRFLG